MIADRIEDLVYLLNLDTSYYFDALKYDREYNYDREYPENFYNSTDYYLTWQTPEKCFEQFRFFDLEEDDNLNGGDNDEFDTGDDGEFDASDDF